MVGAGSIGEENTSANHASTPAMRATIMGRIAPSSEDRLIAVSTAGPVIASPAANACGMARHEPCRVWMTPAQASSRSDGVMRIRNAPSVRAAVSRGTGVGVESSSWPMPSRSWRVWKSVNAAM